MAGLFLGLFILAALAALGLGLWVDMLYHREGRDVAKAKKTAAEQIKDAQAKAKAARIAEEVAEANATQADTRSLQLAAELAELREAHAAELVRLRGVAAAAADDAALARQDAEMKARARGQAEAVWAAQKAEAASALGRAEETLKRSLEAVQDARELVAGPVSPEAARIPGSKGSL